MLPFARLIMQGRGYALAFVMFTLMSSPFFWPGSILAAAGISLVGLRIGVRDGVLLWLWAVLPAVAMSVYLDSFMPLLVVSCACVCSSILRITLSWQYTLMGLSAFCLLTALCLEHLTGGMLAPYVDAFNELLGKMQQQLQHSELKDILPGSVNATFVAGLYAGMLSVAGFCSVALARSWQAKMYNPGGF